VGASVIGKLDQRVTIQTATLAADGGGGSTKTWAALATVWARVVPKTGRESMEADRVNATSSFLFVIRNRSDVNETCRFVWAGETYNVRNVRRTGTRTMYLEIDAERGTA
jgi:SPP1 family predicted phage head-tail adaptor